MDFEVSRNGFAVIGIVAFSTIIVVVVSDLVDHIRWWGMKKGISKWLFRK
jgi:hypothetical protein